MDGVRAAPEIIGRQRQHADDAADPVVGARGGEKNEPWPQSCWIMNRRTRKPAAGTAIRNEAQKWPIENSEPCRRPERDERQRGDRELGNAAGVARLDVAVEQLSQAMEIDRAGMGIGSEAQVGGLCFGGARAARCLRLCGRLRLRGLRVGCFLGEAQRTKTLGVGVDAHPLGLIFAHRLRGLAIAARLLGGRHQTLLKGFRVRHAGLSYPGYALRITPTTCPLGAKNNPAAWGPGAEFPTSFASTSVVKAHGLRRLVRRRAGSRRRTCRCVVGNDVEGNLLPFVERAHAGAFDRADMDEYVLAAVFPAE